MLHRLHPKREFLVASLLSVGGAFAQQPQWTAALPAVPRAGLYAIDLGSELLGASRADLGDIRLIDSTGAQVPYVLRSGAPATVAGAFVPYKLLRNEVVAKSTVIELERPTEELLDELDIWIRPTDAQKRLRITGSDDREAWYMVKDEHVVAQGARGDPPHQVLAVRIPRSDYRYLRLVLNDSLTAPMQVLGVGRFDDAAEQQPCFHAPVQLAFDRTDSTGGTHLRVRHPLRLVVDRLEFTVGDSNSYLRPLHVRMKEHGTMRKGRREVPVTWSNPVPLPALSSVNGGVVDVPALRLDSFDLVIVNGDDRPLGSITVAARSQCRFLLAELIPGMPYRLTTGDEGLNAPVYDMAHFADELPAPMDTLLHALVEALPTEVSTPIGNGLSKAWIWAAIVVLIAGMGLLAVRLLRGQH
jgi:hypothetical protein